MKLFPFVNIIMFLQKKKLESRGFTLIELLVVITIIGILAVVSITNYQSAQEKALDTARIADMNTLLNSTQLYLHTNSVVPHEDSGDLSKQTLEDAMNGVFLTSVPVDPATNQYVYAIGNGRDGEEYGAFEYNSQLASSLNDIQEQSDGGDVPELYENGNDTLELAPTDFPLGVGDISETVTYWVRTE
ncbi:prepilin-type N-terminal cleavage/methylation domain-containing protein [Candidatus Peregrinibacteria bacterium]|nr:prepilin-type N-terminal cleavage/methylation domain-containing protein [Candidatus Peregrinibacteria bacterium]